MNYHCTKAEVVERHGVYILKLVFDDTENTDTKYAAMPIAVSGPALVSIGPEDIYRLMGNIVSSLKEYNSDSSNHHSSRR